MESIILDIKSLSKSYGKLKALNSSVRISGNYEKELEAYIMEDRPRTVRKMLNKYCL